MPLLGVHGQAAACVRGGGPGCGGPAPATNVEYVTKLPAIMSSDGPLVAARFQRAEFDKMESRRHRETRWNLVATKRQDGISSPQKDTMKSCRHGETR